MLDVLRFLLAFFRYTCIREEYPFVDFRAVSLLLTDEPQRFFDIAKFWPKAGHEPRNAIVSLTAPPALLGSTEFFR